MPGRPAARPDAVSTTCNPRSASHQILENESDENPQAKRVRKWKVFPGRNKFYCDGRIIMAHQSGLVLPILFLIIVTSAFFFSFDCRITLVNSFQYGFLIPAVAGVLLIFSLSCFLRTAWSDPGILPRASFSEAEQTLKLVRAVQNNDTQTQERMQPGLIEVLVNGVPITLKFCYTCNILRPPRSSHCRICDNCVDCFDHHCPWVGNCIGRRNYRYFFLFVTSIFILCIYIFVFSIIHMVLLTRSEESFVEALKISPSSVIVALVCFFSVWSVLSLTGYHTYLIAYGSTTNEDLKRIWSVKNNKTGRNPFDLGCCGNCRHILCGPVPPSTIDSRGYVVDERTSGTN